MVDVLGNPTFGFVEVSITPQWARDRFLVIPFDNRWSGQVMEPAEFMPFSGRDGSNRVYVHSGDSGQGMTNGIAGALNFIAPYRNDKAQFAELFDPSRKRGTFKAFTKHAPYTVSRLAEPGWFWATLVGRLLFAELLLGTAVMCVVTAFSPRRQGRRP